jgi:competence ComEA-like helix-hairpin-helix protein
MMIIFGKFIRALLILFFRISGVSFLIGYPVCKFSWKLVNRPWLLDPITQGIHLMLEPLKDLSDRVYMNQLAEETTQHTFLLPPPPPPKGDINRATVEELRSIEGVGFVRALDIVEYRERFGEYRRIEELGLIQGIGSQTLRLIFEQFEVKL